jgi:hypothetical protein
MTHKTLPAEIAELPSVVEMERRTNPDRRTLWRGGRRDRDWKDRPRRRLVARVGPGLTARLARLVEAPLGRTHPLVRWLLVALSTGSAGLVALPCAPVAQGFSPVRILCYHTSRATDATSASFCR